MDNQPDIYFNTFYDGIMWFVFPKPIPPKQTKAKAQSAAFQSYIKNHLEKVYHKGKWPMKGKLWICLSVTGPTDYIQNCDLDNISKAVLDCLKGYVFEDDRSVFSLFAEKRVFQLSGLVVGIKYLIEPTDYFGTAIQPYFLDEPSKVEKPDHFWHFIFDDGKSLRKKH